MRRTNAQWKRTIVRIAATVPHDRTEVEKTCLANDAADRDTFCAVIDTQDQGANYLVWDWNDLDGARQSYADATREGLDVQMIICAASDIPAHIKEMI